MRSAPSSERAVSAPAVVSPPGVAVTRRLTVSLSQRSLWIAAGVSVVAVGAVLVLTRALGAVLLVFFAIILAEAIRPLVAQLERLRVPRPLGALAVYLALALIAIGIGWLLFNPIASQASELADQAPTYLEQAQAWFEDMQRALLANDALSQALTALGLIGSGFLAVPILTGSAAFGVAEAFGWRRGLDEKPWRARPFYAVIVIATLVGMLINFLGINPIAALFWTAVINGFLAPPLLILIMLIANNHTIMGKRTNNWVSNALGWLAAVVMVTAAIALVLTWGH